MDYDIDKAYIMGFSFDQNGLFQDWSPLFNYGNDTLILESLKLSTPNNVQIEISDDSIIDITEYILKIKDLKQQPKSNESDLEILKNQIKALEIIDNNALETGDSKIAKVRCDVLDCKDIIDELQNHENYKFNPDLREEIYKNATQSRILQVSFSIKNMPLAYSEITMEELSDSADDSSKGSMIYGLTAMNPTTKFIMQKQNMDGKAVIGIAAVGEKVFMNLSYYYNEGLKSNNTDYKRHMYFERYTTRIEGRSLGNPKFRLKQTIADNNYYGIASAETLRDRFNKVNSILETIKKLYPNYSDEEALELAQEQIKHNKYDNYTKADLMISLLLSAATDNAKELILNKINAGKDLAKIYLHLLILGYDIKDITAFMISPAVDLVAKLLEVDFYDENLNYSTIDKAIDRARGNINYKLYFSGHEAKNFVTGSFKLFLDAQASTDPNTILKYYGHLNFKFIKDAYNNWIKISSHKSYGQTAHIEFMKYISEKYGKEVVTNFYEEYLKYKEEELRRKFIKDSDEYKIAYALYIKESRFIDAHLSILNQISDTKLKYKNPLDYDADLNELEKVFNESDETTQLGQLLGWNKEVPTLYSELLSKINSLERFIEKLSSKYVIFDKDSIDIEKTLEMIYRDKPYLKEEDVRKYLENAIKFNLHKTFNFHNFIADINYRNAAINYYDLIKTQYNILDVVIKSPNLNKALFVYDIASEMIGMNTAKGAIINYMRDRLKKDGNYLDDNKISKLSSYAEDLLINKFLRENPDIIFPINKGLIYYDELFNEHQSESNDVSKITTYDQMASFKRWCESYLFPLIEEGVVKVGNETIKIPENNEFMNYIIDGTENGRPVKRLSFNMGFIDKSDSVASQFIAALRGLDTIDLDNTTKYKIRDWIQLYSLVTSHNNPGNDRLSKLFGSSLKDPNSLMYKYYQFMGEQDAKSISGKTLDIESYLLELGYNENDALFHIAPTYYDNNVHKAKEKIIKYSHKGIVTYKYRTNDFGIGLDGYSDFVDLPFVKGENVAARYRAFKEDGIGFLYQNSELNIALELLKYDKNIPHEYKLGYIYKGLKRLLDKRKLRMTISC